MRSQKDRIHGAQIYARFSTDHQSDKSIDEQVSDCREWCQAHGLPVLGVYADYAISGMKSSRPQFDAMLDALRAGIGDTLVCYDQSRLSRDFLNWFALRRELQQIGVRIASITQDYVGGNIQDSSVLIQETIIALHNQMHVADTRRKVKAALRYRAQQGQHTGGKPPLGYALKDKRLIIDVKEAAVVYRIFQEYDSGMSYKEIIDGLNRDGITTKRGSAFGANSLHDLMHNRRYIGEFTYGGKAYTDGHRLRSDTNPDAITMQRPELAIVPKDLFERVQIRMQQNKRQQAGRKATRREYPLKGKVYCAECGAAMTVSRTDSKGSSYYYYRCTRKDRLHDCDSRPIRADALENHVLAYVRSILGAEDARGRVMELIRQDVNAIIGSSTEQLETAEAKHKEICKRIDNLTNSLAAIGYSEAVAAKLKEAEAQKVQSQLEIDRLAQTAKLATMPEERMEEILHQVMGSQSDAAIFSVVNRVEVGDDTIRIFTAFDPERDPHDPIDGEKAETGTASEVCVNSTDTFRCTNDFHKQRFVGPFVVAVIPSGILIAIKRRRQ